MNLSKIFSRRGGKTNAPANSPDEIPSMSTWKRPILSSISSTILSKILFRHNTSWGSPLWRHLCPNFFPTCVYVSPPFHCCTTTGKTQHVTVGYSVGCLSVKHRYFGRSICVSTTCALLWVNYSDFRKSIKQRHDAPRCLDYDFVCCPRPEWRLILWKVFPELSTCQLLFAPEKKHMPLKRYRPTSRTARSSAWSEWPPRCY